MVLCECGKFIDNDIFKDYIQTSLNPSTPTIGHSNCGLILNIYDGKMPKSFSSKTELKSIALKFSERNKLEYDTTEKLLLEVDRLKSRGDLSDIEILFMACKNIGLKGNIKY